MGQASTNFHELSNAGWAVWALVPLTRLAGAHEAFQSAVDYVQGWWERKDEFSFTQPEIPEPSEPCHTVGAEPNAPSFQG